MIMSSYVNFYLRVNDSFAPIGSWSRSSELYRAMEDYCPYEKLCAFDSATLMDVIHNLEDKIDRMKEMRKFDENRCQMIMQANNSIDEKLEAIYNIESNFEEIDSSIEETAFAADTLRVFYNMIEDFRFSDDGKFSNDYNHYVYAGIEANGDLESIQE